MDGRKVKTGFSIDPRVLALAEKAAKKGGWSLSSYVEGAILWDLISDGNTEAMGIASRRITAKVLERFKAYMAKAVEA